MPMRSLLPCTSHDEYGSAHEGRCASGYNTSRAPSADFHLQAQALMTAKRRVRPKAQRTRNQTTPSHRACSCRCSRRHHTVRTEWKHHKCTHYIFHNAIPSNHCSPHIPDNAMCNYPEPNNPYRRSTRTPLDLLPDLDEAAPAIELCCSLHHPCLCFPTTASSTLPTRSQNLHQKRHLEAR